MGHEADPADPTGQGDRLIPQVRGTVLVKVMLSIKCNLYQRLLKIESVMLSKHQFNLTTFNIFW